MLLLCSLHRDLRRLEDSVLVGGRRRSVVGIVLMLALGHRLRHVLHSGFFEVLLGGIGTLLVHLGSASRRITQLGSTWHDKRVITGPRFLPLLLVVVHRMLTALLLLLLMVVLLGLVEDGLLLRGSMH